MKSVFFFLGTEAELIKVFPVILECRKRGMDCHIIASGQNDITKSVILARTDCGRAELELSREEDIKKSARGLLSWWIKTYKSAAEKIRAVYPETVLKDSYMVVHGDTVSTFMGARLGRKLGMTVCHIEAGLRSHHLFDPFPEEIDRMLTSRECRVHFAPGDEAAANLKKARGRVINTIQNTLLDSLKISETMEPNEDIRAILERQEPYFIFAMHRQENLADESLVRRSVEHLLAMSDRMHAIIILHAITRNTYEKLGLLRSLEAKPDKITLLSRVDYFSYMKLLNSSAFVITDGGSNQEELYYMGKPALIIRKTTERSEGIGENARLYKDIDDMIRMPDEYKDYERDIRIEASPSKLIASVLCGDT